MRIFLSNEDHSRFLFDCVMDDPEHIFITSFGIYAGMTYDGRDTTQWGNDYRLATRDLLEAMKSVDTVQLLIGISNFDSCKGKFTPCIHCEQKYVKQLLRLLNHAELFPEFEWRLTTELHLKCTLFFYDIDCSPELAKGVAGGRNFTNSNWADVTCELAPEHIRELYDHTHELWDRSQHITEDSIAAVLQDQNISKSGFDVVGL